MSLKASLAGILAIVAGLLASPCSHAATSSDVFINEVTPLAISKLGRGSDLLASIAARRDILRSLRTLQSRQLQALTQLKRLPPAKASAPSIVAQKRELELRRLFYDQVIFSVDAKWNDGPLKAFLEKEFLSRAQNDIDSDESDDVADKDPLWKFYTYLSVAIRDLPEPREDLVSFIQGYIEFSTIAKPKPPAEYVAQRAYSNGLVSQAAHTMPQDEIGDGIERILRTRGLDKASRRAAAPEASRPQDIELRMKLDLTPPEGSVLPPTQRN